MARHQKCTNGNAIIMKYMLDYFHIPKDFEKTIYLSQLLRGLGMKYAVEHFRQNKNQKKLASTSQATCKKQFIKQLHVSSLIDTY